MIDQLHPLGVLTCAPFVHGGCGEGQAAAYLKPRARGQAPDTTATANVTDSDSRLLQTQSLCSTTVVRVLSRYAVPDSHSPSLPARPRRSGLPVDLHRMLGSPEVHSRERSRTGPGRLRRADAHGPGEWTNTVSPNAP